MTGGRRPARLLGVITSNSYRDRQGETITGAALRAWVERHWRGGRFGGGPLLFWHDGPPIADLVYAEVDGPFLLELALERPTPFARAVVDEIARRPPGTFGASHGFVHDGGADGIYHRLEKFETSVLPLEYAANPYTLTGVYPMNSTREQYLARIPGAAAALAHLRRAARDTRQRLDADGVAHKVMPDDGGSLAAQIDAILAGPPETVRDRLIALVSALTGEPPTAEKAALDIHLKEMALSLDDLAARLGQVERALTLRPRAASQAAETVIDEASLDALTALARKAVAERDAFWGTAVEK